MTHDALCDGDDYEGPFCSVRCSCDLISKVREDERRRFDDDGADRDIRAAALRDAVEAVKLSCSADIELVERTEVIAAIEALKEKP